MCEYRFPPMTTNCSASPEVETAALPRRKAFESTLLEYGVPMETRQPFVPGGGSPAAMSPLAATSRDRLGQDRQLVEVDT